VGDGETQQVEAADEKRWAYARRPPKAVADDEGPLGR
jgi:hypothetical protein